MANAIGGHELARWACALGGTVLVHGSLLLSNAAEHVVAPIVRPEPVLVWLDAAVAPDAPSGIAGLAVAERSPSPPRARKPRSKPAKPIPGPSSESAALPPAADPDVDAQAPLPLDAEHAGATDELASVGTPAWGDGSLVAATTGGGGSGGGALPSNKPSFPPGLMAFGDPCRGFYPSAADADHGEVRVVVRVGRDGSTRGSEVVAENPALQGFGPAARACVSRLRFRPARDASGDAIPGQAVLALSFDRS